MRIDVFLNPSAIPNDWPSLPNTTAVIIDVLRASTTICAALANGADSIVPIAEIEDARAYKKGNPGVLLAGERDGRRIEGFDLGNSPLEYLPQKVQGREIVHCSTNGTKMIERASGAESVLICGIVNLKSVAEVLRGKEQIGVLCSGKLGSFSIEDAGCAGYLLEELGYTPNDDASLTALALSRYFRDDPYRLVSTSSHGQYLASIGFEKDLETSAHRNLFDFVPSLIEKKVRRIHY